MITNGVNEKSSSQSATPWGMHLFNFIKLRGQLSLWKDMYNGVIFFKINKFSKINIFLNFYFKMHKSYIYFFIFITSPNSTEIEILKPPWWSTLLVFIFIFFRCLDSDLDPLLIETQNLPPSLTHPLLELLKLLLFQFNFLFPFFFCIGPSLIIIREKTQPCIGTYWGST